MEPTQASATERLRSVAEAFGPGIASTRESWLYRIGLVLVAACMVLLVAAYASLVVAVGFLVWLHASRDLDLLTREHTFMNALMYVVPIIVGLLVLGFLLKPFFAKRGALQMCSPVEPKDEAALFVFIEGVCKLVGAPIPKTVCLNCGVNASAGFRRGLFGKDLVLTIGLPLVAGLNMRQFATVLAHEFGHFTQGTGMRLSYLIRRINLWFAESVYDPDNWDLQLAEAARTVDVRVLVVASCARGAIWLTRRILAALLYVGQVISCLMLRQMEYHADSCAAKVSGSEVFTETTIRVRVLSAVAQTVPKELLRLWRKGVLPEDLPGLINGEASLLPTETLREIEAALAQAKTGWFDTHPADSDRMQAVQKAHAPGVFALTEPAASLFADFSAACKTVTRSYYANYRLR
jgi:Zn-dependent protease with chaperone function